MAAPRVSTGYAGHMPGARAWIVRDRGAQDGSEWTGAPQDLAGTLPETAPSVSSVRRRASYLTKADGLGLPFALVVAAPVAVFVALIAAGRASQMEREQLAEARVADRLAMRALNDVEIRCPVSLHELRPVLHDADVPADQDPVGELRVRAHRQSERLPPERQAASTIRAPPFGWVSRQPVRRPPPEIGCGSERAAREVDRGGETTRMEVVDDAISPLRHPQHGVGGLELPALVPAGHDPHRRAVRRC